MYCRKCGRKLEESERFCGACGEPVVRKAMNPTNNEFYGRQAGYDHLQRQEDNSRRYGDNMSKQPTKALVVEGIGFLFFIYMAILNGGDFLDQRWLEENGGGVFLIGLIFIVISYFMLRSHKKKYNLYGIGYAGYIISCIAVVIMIVIILLSVLMILMIGGTVRRF